MLHRKHSGELICITQPTHAWVAGQLARAWGNDHFGSFAPWEEVCLATLQHDIGWHRWEGAPTLNSTTGYPYSFTELPTAVSVDIWTRVKEVVTPLGRYPTLLISLHGTGLFQRYTSWQRSTEAIQLVEQYLSQEEVFQQHLVNVLQSDPHYECYANPTALARNRQLVATWDTLSLMLCMGVHEPRQVEQVPTATGETNLVLAPIDANPTRITVAPWAFRSDSVTLVFEGRVLRQSFVSEEAMREALRTADWVTIMTTLTPA
jgi:hypothetical protein